MKAEDTARVRGLARQVRALADDEIQQKNRALWTAVNDLNAIRPVCHIRSIPLRLIGDDPAIQPQCDDPLARRVERNLLLRLYEWAHLRCDRVVEPVLDCPALFEDTGFDASMPGTFPAERAWIPGTFIASDPPETAVEFLPRIASEADLAIIQTPEVRYDEKATMERLSRVRDLVGDILPVKLFGRCDFGHNLWDELLKWMGLNEGMMNFSLEPELMHLAAARYVDAAIAQVKQYESLGLLTSNNRFDNIGNNGIGYTSALPGPTESGIGARLGDLWGAGADQVLTCVSPAMTEAFAFDHERRYADLFGLFSYGCCERLDNKVAGLRGAFPNLRKISMSPYSDLAAGMEAIGRDYVVCFKPNSNYLAMETVDWAYLRSELETACALATRYRANLVFNMKTIITVHGEPERLWKWCALAEEVLRGF